MPRKRNDELPERATVEELRRQKKRAAWRRWAAKKPTSRAAYMKTYQQKWAEKNRLKLRTYQREYQKTYRKKFPEKARASEKRYAEKYPFRVRAARQKRDATYNTSVKGLLTQLRYTTSNKGRLTSIAKSARRRAKGYVSRVELEQIQYAFGGKCAYCRAPYECFDHVGPIAHGGVTSSFNLVPACNRCNQSKRDKHWLSWFKEQPFFTKLAAGRIRQRLR